MADGHSHDSHVNAQIKVVHNLNMSILLPSMVIVQILFECHLYHIIYRQEVSHSTGQRLLLSPSRSLLGVISVQHYVSYPRYGFWRDHSCPSPLGR